MTRIEHLIDGRAVPGRSCFETLNPSNQTALAEVAAADPDPFHHVHNWCYESCPTCPI